MSETGIATFQTRLGTCGLAWGPAGLLATRLPGWGSASALPFEPLRRRFPGLAAAPPPAWVQAAIDSIAAHLAGERVALAEIRLDFADMPEFEAAVYRTARMVPSGTTVTYGELARRLGNAGLARAVGQALGRNPWPIVVPCHRVTGAAGRTGGFSAPGGGATKLRLLELEGALAARTLPLFAAPAVG